MRNVTMFVEDHGHEAVLKALIHRLARQYHVSVNIIIRTARGGHGRVLSTLKEYISDLKNDQESTSDLLVIATDGNCTGYLERKQEIDKVMRGFAGSVIYAIPDPHVERWLLLDSVAFKRVLGKGCSAPGQKCDRGQYKRLLLDAVRLAGINPPLGGIEYAEDLVNEMDLERLERSEESLGKFLKPLRQHLQSWQRIDQGEH